MLCKDGGTGLGLSICKRIVLCHHAELKFISHAGEGTTAQIIFDNFITTP